MHTEIQVQTHIFALDTLSCLSPIGWAVPVWAGGLTYTSKPHQYCTVALNGQKTWGRPVWTPGAREESRGGERVRERHRRDKQSKIESNKIAGDAETVCVFVCVCVYVCVCVLSSAFFFIFLCVRVCVYEFAFYWPFRIGYTR